MTWPVSDAASNSHPVAVLNGRTNIPLASGEGSGGRDHSLLRLLSQAKFRSAHLDPPEPIRPRKIEKGKAFVFRRPLSRLLQGQRRQSHISRRRSAAFAPGASDFVSLELSRSTWLVTSLSPGGGEKDVETYRRLLGRIKKSYDRVVKENELDRATVIAHGIRLRLTGRVVYTQTQGRWWSASAGSLSTLRDRSGGHPLRSRGISCNQNTPRLDAGRGRAFR